MEKCKKNLNFPKVMKIQDFKKNEVKTKKTVEKAEKEVSSQTSQVMDAKATKSVSIEKDNSQPNTISNTSTIQLSKEEREYIEDGMPILATKQEEDLYIQSCSDWEKYQAVGL